MAIDVRRDPDFTYTFLQRWDVDGHEVALMTMADPKGTSNARSERHLLCECDFPEDPNKPVVDGEPGDPHACSAKEAMRKRVMQEARDRYGSHWRKLGIKEATLDIYKKVTAGEYFGESWVGFVYVQEVEELLCVKTKEVRNACDELYGEEKLELNGAILWEFTPRFRFPLEMEGIIAYVVEAPLGWPNGRAGTFAVAEIENEIAKRTGIQKGQEAFGHHFPHIDLQILVPAMEWIAGALLRAAKKIKEKERLKTLSAYEITKDFKGMVIKYPDIRIEFYAEFVRALVQVVLRNTEWARGTKEKEKARMLRGEAKYFANWAKRYSQNPVT